MSKDFEKLKSIGIQKIYESTHISRAHIKSIFDENFENMSSVQIFGFISILEREYNLDLSELKEIAKEHFKNNLQNFEKVNKTKLFTTEKKKIDSKLVYIALVIVFGLFTIFILNPSQKKEISSLDNSTIESASTTILENANELNSSTLETNTTLQNMIDVQEVQSNEALKYLPDENITTPATEEINKEKTEPTPETALKITPKSKVWLGYIDMRDNVKHQSVFSDEFTLDASKDWLLSFGHGHINIYINGVVKEFTNPKNIRFSYIDAELKEISYEEFKTLNKGSGW